MNLIFTMLVTLYLVLVLLALFAPKEAVEREMEKGENKNEMSDPHVKAERSSCKLSTTTSSQDLVNVFATLGN